jgi:hypothetical protein
MVLHSADHDFLRPDDVLLSLKEVAKRFPGRRAGKKLSVETVWRWSSAGVHNGIRLKTVLVGGHRISTLRWVNEFIESVNQAAGTEDMAAPKVRTPRQRQTASERATEALKAAWTKRKE